MTGRQNVCNTARGSNRLPALASQISAVHNAALAAATSATEHAIKCGELLMEAKAGLEHGRWLPWVQKNCPFSERTAQAYMRLAERVLGGFLNEMHRRGFRLQ